VQYGLLFGFAGVAAAISAHGLIGFARANMGLRGPWPVLLWGALDGAAGLCAVLLMRRAARGESAAAPRLAVWGLVAASSTFNWTHAPHHPGARAAFAMMPLIAAVLFEFSLRETRHTARPSGRRLAGARWLHPAERVRVWARLADRSGRDPDSPDRCCGWPVTPAAPAASGPG
jgi:apolipoprotein N-acyltransferase